MNEPKILAKPPVLGLPEEPTATEVAPTATVEAIEVPTAAEVNTTNRRKALRDAIFNSAVVEPRIFPLFGSEVEIKQPTLADSGLFEKLQDGEDTLVLALIAFCYVPGTHKKVFEEGDIAALRAKDLTEEVTNVIRAMQEGLEVKEAVKN